MLKGNFLLRLALSALLLFCGKGEASSLCEANHEEEAASGMLYTIKSSASAESYLYGTLHAGFRKLHALPDTAMQALSKSRKLYLESLWTDEELLKNRIDMQNLPAGKTLQSVLDKKTYARFQQHLDILRVTNETRLSFDKMAPAAALSFFTPRAPELDDSAPIDDLLVTAARSIGLEIDGLETKSEAIAGWKSISNEDWSAYAAEILDTSLCHACAEERTALLSCMTEFVRLGKTSELFSMYEKFNATHPAQAVVLQKMTFSRNLAMAEKIGDLLQQQQPVFIAIGALHIGGQIGVVSRLRKMGYSVEQIK